MNAPDLGPVDPANPRPIIQLASPIDPPPRARTRTWWFTLTITQKAILIILAAVTLYLGLYYTVRVVLGYVYYASYYISASRGQVLSESCYGIMQERNPFWNWKLSNREWFRLQRCKGDEQGTERLKGGDMWGVRDVVAGLFLGEGRSSPLLAIVSIVFSMYWVLPWVLGQALSASAELFKMSWGNLFWIVFVLGLIPLYIFSRFWTFLSIVSVVFGMSYIIYNQRFGLGHVVQPAAQAARVNPAAHPAVQVFDYVMEKIMDFWNADNASDPVWQANSACRHRDPCHCFDILRGQNQSLEGQVEDLGRDLQRFQRYRDNCERQHVPGIVEEADQWGLPDTDEELESPSLDPGRRELRKARREIANLKQERDSARRVNAALECDRDNIHAAAQRAAVQYQAKIDKLQKEVNWAQGTAEGYNLAQVDIEEKKSEIKKLKKQVEELSKAGSELRGQIAWMKENTINKCQNEAGCQMQIREMKEKYEHVMNTHREMELQVRDAAILLGETPHSAQHMNLSSYVNQVTLVLLELKRLRAIGAPGANTVDLQYALRDKEYIEQKALLGRLEKEVEYLGGDVAAIRAGFDTRKPRNFHIIKLTYEENARRVQEVYLDVFEVVRRLGNFFVENNITPPKWANEISRDCKRPDDDKGMELFWLEFGNTECNPCYANVEELSEHLMRTEVERWYDRGMTLLRTICKLPGFQEEMLKQKGNIEGPLYPHQRILNHCLDVVLDDIRPLVVSDTDTKPNPVHRRAKQFKIYQSMQEAIYGLTKAIITDKRGPLIPKWNDPDSSLQPPLPPPLDNAIMDPEKLSTMLVTREMLILERRINQLLRFMDENHLPGTLTGGPFEHRQGNPEYEKNWRSCVAIRAWSSLVISHWHLHLSQKPVLVPDLKERGGFRIEYEPEDNLLPLDQGKFLQSAGLKDQFKKLGWREQIGQGKWPDNIKEPQLQYSAVIGPWLRLMKPGSSTDPDDPDYSSDEDPKKAQTAEYLSLDLELRQHKARVDQLKNFINDWGIRHALAIPNTDKLVRRNAKIETLRKALVKYKAYVLDLERHANKFKKQGQVLPAWPKDGGAMKPAWSK